MSSEKEKAGGNKRCSEEGEEEEEHPAKKSKLEDVDAGPSEAPESSHSVEEGESKGESDEEYEIESSDESEEGGYSDVESGDSSSDLDVGEEEGGEDTEIISGYQVEMKVVKDGKFRLLKNPNGKEFKMIISGKDKSNAMDTSKQKQKANTIPLLKASGIEVVKDNEYELSVYVEALTAGSEVYSYCSEECDDDLLIPGNTCTVIKVDDFPELYATSDLL